MKYFGNLHLAVLLVVLANTREVSAGSDVSNVERFNVADGINAIAANLGNAFAASLLNKHDFGAVGTIENYSKFPLRLRDCKNSNGQVIEPLQEKIAPGGSGRFSMFGDDSGGVKHECTYVLVKEKCQMTKSGGHCNKDVLYRDINIQFHLKSKDESTIRGQVCKWSLQECKNSDKAKYQAMKFCNVDLGFCMEGQIGSGKHTNAFWAVYPCSKQQFCPNSECKSQASDNQSFEDLIKTFEDGQDCLDTHNNK